MNIHRRRLGKTTAAVQNNMGRYIGAVLADPRIYVCNIVYVILKAVRFNLNSVCAA